MSFDPKRASERELFWVDFTDLLPSGVTIDSASWSITSVNGVDPQAAAMIIGVATISDSQVSQMIGGGVPSIRYAPICTANFSDGQVRTLPEYGQGQFEVTL